MAKGHAPRKRGKSVSAPDRRDTESAVEAAPAPRPPLGPRAAVAPLACGIAFLLLYVVTLSPSVAGGDSGELSAAVGAGGVAHPPGYPLHGLLGRLLALVPVGSVAYRVNLLSAVCGAGAVALLAAAVQAAARASWPGVLAAALFGANALAWRLATEAEVFALHALLIALLLRLWVASESRGTEAASPPSPIAGGLEPSEGSRQEPRPRLVQAAALVTGLALANHHTAVFVAAPLLARMAWRARAQLGWRGLAAPLGCGALGLSPYVLLPLAAASAAPVSWGNPTSWSGFVAHVLRREYGTFQLGSAEGRVAFVAGGNFLATLGAFVVEAWTTFLGLGVLLALAAPATLRSGETRVLARGAALVLAGYVVLFAALSNLATGAAFYRGILARFWLQADVLLAFLAGLGAAGLGPEWGA